MNKLKLILLAVAAATIILGTANADVLAFENYSLLGSYRSDGLVDLGSIGTWNGKPISDTNKPNDYERQLAATLNFYSRRSDPNVLFLQVTDVVATHFGFAFGTAFTNITQTGVQFTLPTVRGINLGTPSFSSAFANPGQIRAFAPPDRSSEPLTTTPGFQLLRPAQNKFLVQTISGAEFGFINTGWSVFGGSVNRIEGGGVFELTFPERINLFRNVNFASATVDSEYGHGNQYIRAHVLEVPTLTGHFTPPTVLDVHPDSPASTLDAAKAFFDDVSLFNCIPRVNGASAGTVISIEDFTIEFNADKSATITWTDLPDAFVGIYVKGGSQGGQFYGVSPDGLYDGMGIVFAPNTGNNLDHPAGISHIDFFCGPRTNQVPDSGTTALLLGNAFIGLGLARRLTRH